MHIEAQREEAIVRPPEYRRGYQNDVIVLTMDGLLKVLHGREHEAKLAAFPDGQYTVFFRDWSADIGPSDELWEKIAEITQHYALEIVPNGLYCSTDHQPWTGSTNSFGRVRFKHMKITNCIPTAAAA